MIMIMNELANHSSVVIFRRDAALRCVFHTYDYLRVFPALQ